MFTPSFLVRSMLLIFSVFCVVLLRILTFRVPCCDVRHNFRIKTMFGSSLSPVVRRRVRVLFTFACVSWCVLGIVLVFVLCIVFLIMPFSLDCPSYVITVCCSLTFIHSPCIMGISKFYNQAILLMCFNWKSSEVSVIVHFLELGTCEHTFNGHYYFRHRNVVK